MDSEEENRKEDVFSLAGDEDVTFQRHVDEVAGLAQRAPEAVERNESQEALAKKTEELQQVERKYVYLLAEFDNYKKRVQRDLAEQTKFANERLLREMLVLVDGLERAILHSKEAPNAQKIAEGVELILKQSLACFGRYGVLPMESLGKPFDPAYHQAVGQVVRHGFDENQVIEEVQKGYLLHDRVLRAAMVLIAQRGLPPEGIVGEGEKVLGESIDKKV